MSGPTLASYIAWARSQGCVVGTEPVTRDGHVLNAVCIWAPSGLGVVEIAIELDDPLMSTTVARLDRRLGMKSYLFT